MSESPDRLVVALQGRYAIERELGAGGMATVYLAHDLKHDRKVALKVLKPELAAVLGAERFVQEIRTTANLQHPHILPLFDSGTADGFLYYVMPYIDGETLREKLDRETQLGVDEAVKIATEVADALDYAHRQEVIHRDIKPENILLHDGRPMVADFGIALAVSAAAGGRMTETGLSLGTPHYMSPEQATAERQVTHRSDIYSLGCVLYEMLAGDPPHTGSSAQAIIMKIVSEEAQPVTKLRKSVPANVAAAVAKALEKLSADRFETAAEFAVALANPAFSPGHPVTGFEPATRLKVGRYLWPAATALLAAAAFLLAKRTEADSGPVMRFVAVAESDRLEGSPTMLPDGSGLLYLARGGGVLGRGLSTALSELGAQRQLYFRPLGELEAVALEGSDGAAQPAVSPDGRWVVFVNGGNLYRVTVAGGPASDLPVTSGTVYGVTWVSSSTIVYGSGSGLWSASVNGGDATLLTGADTASGMVGYRWPEALPNQAVFLTLWRGDLEDAQIAVLPEGSDRPMELGLRGTNAQYVETGYIVYARSDGSLHAASFDPRRPTRVGVSVPILAGVAVDANGHAHFSISRDGTLAYMSAASDARRLVQVDRRGFPTYLTDQRRIFDEPSYSPDGNRVAVSIRDGTTRDIWLLDLRQGPLTLLTHGGDDRYPQWTPDGSRIVFTSYRSGPATVLLQAADGSAEPRLLGASEDLLSSCVVSGGTAGCPPDRFPVSWTPDGRMVLIQEITPVSRRNILGLLADEPGDPVTYLSQEWEEFSPALSPDGRWMAYVSNETGRLEVYVRAFPTMGGKTQISTSGATEPRWSPDGGELFYRSVQNEFISARVQAGLSFTILDRTVLFEDGFVRRDWMASYDVHPDGDRFLFTEPVVDTEPGPILGDRGVPELVIIRNFSELLREKVGK